MIMNFVWNIDGSLMLCSLNVRNFLSLLSEAINNLQQFYRSYHCMQKGNIYIFSLPNAPEFGNSY